MRYEPMDTTEHRQRRDRIRAAVMADLARAREEFLRCTQVDQSYVFTWHGEEFWVDRARMLVLSAFDVARWRPAATLPDDGELGDATNLVEVFGGSARLETSSHLLQLFAWLLRGVQQRHLWIAPALHVLNLAVVQPVVNPAFGPLFWLALAHDLAPPGPRPNFYDLVGPMLIDTAVPPELRRTAAQVRAAQLELVETLAPSCTIAGGQELPEADWVRCCEEQLDAHQQLVDAHVFDELWSRAGALEHEPGARPIP